MMFVEKSPRFRANVIACAAVCTLGATATYAANFSVGNRWTSTVNDGSGLQRGDAITLTWSLVPDGTPIFNGRSSDFIGRLDAVYGAGPGGSDLTQRPWFNNINQAFALYEGKVGVSYIYAPFDDGAPLNTNGASGVRGDVRIGGYGSPFDFPALGVNNFPNNGGDMFLNTTPGAGGNFFNNPAALRGIIMHEHAHGLGLGHTQPCCGLPPTVVQGSGFNGNGPQYDDLLGLHRLYGDALELNGGNDTIANATDLGGINPGQTRSRGTDATAFAIPAAATDIVSIDGTSDADVFRFTVTGRSQANITVAPVGPTYQITNEGQAQQTINGKQQANLAYDVFAADGTRLFSNDRAAIGGSESYAGFRIATPGDYFVRVRSTDNANQFYQLDVAVNNTAGGADTNLLIEDNFTLPTNPTANGVNSFRLNNGRQATGVIESAYRDSSTDPANTSLEILNDQLVFSAIGSGSGPTRQTVDLMRNFAPEVAGQRWRASFDLELQSEGNVADGWFGFTFNDDEPIGLPFAASAEMSMLIRETGGITLRENGTDGATANVGSGPFFVELIVDESGAEASMSVLVNSVAVLTDETVALSDLGRYLSFTLHNGGSSDVGSIFTGRFDNFALELAAIPEPASLAMIALGGLTLRRRRR